MTTPLSGALRLLSGLFLLLTVGWAGYSHRSAWIILLFGIVFTALYVQGKWPQWKKGWEEGGLVGRLAGLALTFPLQLVLASLVYLIGLGLGHLFTSQTMATYLTRDDYWTAGILLAVMSSAGFIIIWLEARKKEALRSQAEMFASMLEATDDEEE